MLALAGELWIIRLVVEMGRRDLILRLRLTVWLRRIVALLVFFLPRLPHLKAK